MAAGLFWQFIIILNYWPSYFRYFSKVTVWLVTHQTKLKNGHIKIFKLSLDQFHGSFARCSSFRGVPHSFWVFTKARFGTKLGQQMKLLMISFSSKTAIWRPLWTLRPRFSSPRHLWERFGRIIVQIRGLWTNFRAIFRFFENMYDRQIASGQC